MELLLPALFSDSRKRLGKNVLYSAAVLNIKGTLYKIYLQKSTISQCSQAQSFFFIMYHDATNKGEFVSVATDKVFTTKRVVTSYTYFPVSMTHYFQMIRELK